ncbi:glycosyltransferase family 4 protein [Sutcliffiella horikoshii]|uniref:Glycosyltransferase family 4 protein n=1 Tax=Sutcliffiella horikoshii TaxID=79883 RepID=A0AA94WS92_9BACI|nr:glycosyltransferase family 4 protein [Sutcliffiella horikoshii]TYS59864.1 glycosyltransferase family 4 protein [Sutcliffiella horikoshii]
MKDILIIAHFTQVPGEAGNGRFHYIAEKIDKKYSTVEVVTTTFSHRTKKQRYLSKEQYESLSYKLTMLEEPGYKKNVSLKRFYSHFIMGKSLKRYLKYRNKPDIIYCSVPSLDVAKVAATFAKENDIKFILDIQDLWPEAFKMVFNIPYISDKLFYPMEKKANHIYKAADEIIAVSQTYVDRALEVNSKCRNAYSVFLGTELTNFDILAMKNKNIEKPKNEIWLAYAGTLGHSYDLTSAIDALCILQKKGINNIKFVIMGDGPLKSSFEKYAAEKQINVLFTGRLDYGKMVGILVNCDIAINPISKGAAQSIINKHGDYAAAGLPVINTQESLEYRDLVNEYQMGINCKNNDAENLALNLQRLYVDIDQRRTMGINSRRLAEEKFNRSITYKKIIDLITN